MYICIYIYVAGYHATESMKHLQRIYGQTFPATVIREHRGHLNVAAAGECSQILWENGVLMGFNGKSMVNLWIIYGKSMVNLWIIYG